MKFLRLCFKAQYHTLVIILTLSSDSVHLSENRIIFTSYVNSLGTWLLPFLLFSWMVHMFYLLTICCVLQSVLFLKICDCTAKEEANCLPGSGCRTGSCRPSGGSAQLLSAKEKLSQERLFQTRSWSRRERSTSATNPKVWKLLRTGSRNITAGFRADGKKSFFLCRASIHPLLYKKFYFSCRFLQNWVAAWATGSFQRQDTA